MIDLEVNNYRILTSILIVYQSRYLIAKKMKKVVLLRFFSL